MATIFPLKVPTAKEKKYDRQLRLWGASGQTALEEAHILLINDGMGVVGVEALKNLVLPGIGQFTIVDEKVVEEKDLGTNFFLTEDSLGKSRAEECCTYLCELNPEVTGTGIMQTPARFVSSPNRIGRYTLILVVGPTSSSQVLKPLTSIAWEKSIPLLYIHSNGFYSQFSLQLPSEFPLVDTHPDPLSTEDLRLLRPWTMLREFALEMTYELSGMTDYEHGHVPYLLLLLHYVKIWRHQHLGYHNPTTYQEKLNFRDMVEAGERKDNPEGGEENYAEAIAAVLKSVKPPSISSGLREVFEAESCLKPKPESANFWIIAHAVKGFHTAETVLPLNGKIPDMKAQSLHYIQLSNLYKTRAREELNDVIKRVRELETRLRRKTPIDEKEIEAFVKGANSVKLVRGTPLQIPEEPRLMDWKLCATQILQELGNEESLISIYLSLLALDDYYECTSGSNSTTDKSLEAEESELRKLKWSMTQYTEKVIEQLKKFSDVDIDIDAAHERLSKVIMELARGSSSELHNISALTGGMVAQEAIKVLTRQYVPIDNTCVFDGITSKSAVFKL